MSLVFTKSSNAWPTILYINSSSAFAHKFECVAYNRNHFRGFVDVETQTNAPDHQIQSHKCTLPIHKQTIYTIEIRYTG